MARSRPQILLQRRERRERGRAEIRTVRVAEEHERPVSVEIARPERRPALIDQAKIRQRARGREIGARRELDLRATNSATAMRRRKPSSAATLASTIAH